MTAKKSENGYNTNLASEYFIMSSLCRSGKEAYLSMGNKKGVDIIVKTAKGAICIVEVKGVNKRNDWMIGNSGELPHAENLLYALVCYNGKIEDPTYTPDFWIIPSMIFFNNKDFKISKNNKTIYISNKLVRDNYDKFKNFLSLEEYLNSN